MTDATNAATPENNVIVLFGATGDLAGRKLFPGLFHLFELGLMPEGFRIVGSAHSELSDDEFRSRVRSSIENSDRASPGGDHVEQFVQRLSYAAVTDELEKVVAAVESARKA